ncbi:MAG: cysteine desulfurase [Gemmatimonadota bacterium]|nr:MAG: cysteine desulfurase [Gemmatimonadota bacterium]
MNATPSSPPGIAPLDVERIRRDFPLLKRQVNGHRLVYLDSAATTQRPSVVIDAVRDFYEQHNANVHRGVHQLSQEATAIFEATREKARAFVNAPEVAEMIYVRGTTEAINLVAQSWARPRLKPGDEILVTTMEHHSNIVPWQLVAEQTGAVVRPIAIDDDGTLDLDDLDARLSERTRVVAVGHVSNSLGTVNPIAHIAKRARSVGAITVVDGAQAAPHYPIDVQALGCDFYAFSGHKVFGPTGVGFLWGRREWLDAMPPWMGGGDMINSVSFQGSTWAPLPSKFEAGTPNVGGAAGLGAAFDYVSGLGLDRIAQHDHELLQYGTARLLEVDGLRLIGTSPKKTGILSFVLAGIHPHDIGTIVDRDGVAIRTGHHCAQPVMERFGVPATVRASLTIHNDRADIDRLVESLEGVRRMFG